MGSDASTEVDGEGPGDLGPRYERIRELGRGGMGRVLLARDLHLGRPVALKLLHASVLSLADLERVREEFALLAAIEHPGIARAHDFGFLRGQPFFTTEYVPGLSLAAAAPPGGAKGILELAMSIAEPLAFLHRFQVLHLDIKPANLILPSEAERAARGALAVLIDFGLFRKGMDAGAASRRGSLPYMAPEHWSGGDIGPWTDVYALGVTLYRTATGAFPRKGPTDSPPGKNGRLDFAQAWDPAPPPPSKLEASFPARLDGIVLKCIALDPGSRFTSAEEALDALRRAAGSARPPLHGRAPALSETVGRSTELVQVDRFLDGVLSKDAGAALLVTGAPGMGQSHLLRELKVRAQTRGLAVYLETGFPGRTSKPGSILRSLAGHMERGEGLSRWRAFLSRLRNPGKAARNETTEGERRLRCASEMALAVREVRSPVLLAVDGLDLWDEVSIALAVDLIRYLGDSGREERPPIGIAVGYREQGTSKPLLQELTEYLLVPSKGIIITLGLLGLEDARALYRRHAGTDGEIPRGLDILSETAGSPAEIVALAARRGKPVGDDRARERSSAGEACGLDERSRSVLLVLDLLERPSGASELARLTGSTRGRLGASLDRLRARGLVDEAGSDPSRQEWMPLPGASGLSRELPMAARRRLHARIAKDLLRRSTGRASRERPGELYVEAVRHLRAAGLSREVARHGIAAARLLRSNFQNRAALEILRWVLEAIPRRRIEDRHEAGLELAEVHARAGDAEEGIRVLREILPPARRLPPSLRARTLLRLAVLHGRQGAFRRADSLFREGFLLTRKGRGLPRSESIHYLCEHAAVLAVTGRSEEALRLCDDGMKRVRGARSAVLREAALNLLAARANVALRGHDFEAAARDFERSLEMAEAIGSPGNQAVILNNLGIVYNHCDRYPEAIRCYREAERTSMRIDEGPSLASIYGNLAILHAKTGDFPSMERALESGERLVPVVIGRRQAFFLEHARGLSLVNRGRYHAARKHLEAAVRLGQDIGDRHVVAFDEVYRAECLVFEADHAGASRLLHALCDAGMPGRARRMAIARRAFQEGLLGRPEEVCRLCSSHASLSSERPVPYLDAWESLFLGWGLSLSGDAARALPLIGEAETFFSSRGLPPAACLAHCVRAECHLIQGDVELAGAALEAMGEPARPAGRRGDLCAVLVPLLRARLTLEDAGRSSGRARAADLVAEASLVLAENPLPEWSARAEALRAALRPGDVEARAEVEKLRARLAGGIPAAARSAYLESRHWRAWTSIPPGDAPARRSRGRAPEVEPGTNGAATRILPGPGSARSRLEGPSQAMRQVLSTLDRLRRVDLAVLITGETGTGKELIARAIHAESRRSAKPFLVLDCAAMPAGLLEAELFGAQAGAYTGLSRDRPGLFHEAEGGTVFMDEVAALALDTQAKLLRAVGEGRVRPLGGGKESAIDVRFIFATSRDLEAEARAGNFRADLLHRIRVATVRVPPLRERPEDLPGLVHALLAEGKGAVPEIEEGVMEKLQGLPWAGNVRELKNFMARLSMEHPRRITLEAVEGATKDSTSSFFPRNLLAGESLPSLQARLERDYLVFHLRRLGDTSALCRHLGLGRRQLYRRLQKLGISLWKEKGSRRRE